MKATKRKVLSKIERFLKEKRKSRGGWAAIINDDIELLSSIISDLIDLKCEADCDGSRPIDFTLVDRTRHESFHYQPLPYIARSSVNEIIDTAMRTVHLNLGNATHDAERLFRHIELRRREQDLTASTKGGA